VLGLFRKTLTLNKRHVGNYEGTEKRREHRIPSDESSQMQTFSPFSPGEDSSSDNRCFSEWSKGEVEIGAEILLRISREFGKSLEWLLTGAERK